MIYYPEVKLAPSILAADYSKLGQEIKDIEKKGVDLIHIDVMDGHFVPNITLGPDLVKDLRKITNLPLDVHLMISEPEFYIPRFIDAGADIITYHIEIFIKKGKLDLKNLIRVYRKIKTVRRGLTLNPSTSVDYFKKILVNIDLDFILIMSVDPGFGGQKFLPQVLKKAQKLRKDFGFRGDLEIDGGINNRTSREALKAGCNILVAGSYIFKARERAKAITLLRENIEKYWKGGIE